MEIQQDAQLSESTPEHKKRERSRISFPYGDLDDAVQVACVLRDRYGSSCAPDQLAAALGHDSSSSGAFRTKLASARIFGAAEVSRGRISITDLGARLADSAHEDEARAEAFLNVPLYRSVYDEFRGQRLPGDKGLEFEMGRLGVSSKQLNKARVVFQRSAEQAGFFAHGRDRLVMPSLGSAPASVQPEPQGQSEERRIPREDTMSFEGLHPLLVGLIKTIPRDGEDFSSKRQKQWLEAAKVNFALIFGSDDDEETPPQSGYAQRAADH